MSDPRIPATSLGVIAQTFVPTRHRTVVTAAETDTDTHWKATSGGFGGDNFVRNAPAAQELANDQSQLPMAQGESLVPVAQNTRLVELETRTRTHWAPSGGRGMSLDQFVSRSGILPRGTEVSLPQRLDLTEADLVGQRTRVTGADTRTDTKWKVTGEGEDKVAEVKGQKTVLTDLDTRTRQRWVFDGGR